MWHRAYMRLSACATDGIRPTRVLPPMRGSSSSSSQTSFAPKRQLSLCFLDGVSTNLDGALLCGVFCLKLRSKAALRGCALGQVYRALLLLSAHREV